jgi:multicomponent Na+:H+ antiporter subunit B
MMSTLVNIALLAFLALVALGLTRTTHLFAAVVLSGIYSLLMASIFITLDAVDVAFTEAAVGAGISTVLFLSTLTLTGSRGKPSRRYHWSALAATVITGGALVYGTLDMPHFGDPQAPIHHHVAPRYIKISPTEIGVPNMVTSVLASYRGYDTLGETAVIVTACMAVLLLLQRDRRARNRSTTATPDEDRRSKDRSIQHAMILRVFCKFFIPLALLFALYVQFHGDYGPGGGFQAGVIFAAGLILYALVFGLEQAKAIIPSSVLHGLVALGLLIYAGTGIASIFNGGQFLEYKVLAHEAVHGEHLGIFMIELGVGTTVAAAMTTIYFTFAGRGRS